MFWHNFKYSLKNLFKNKMLIFWTFAFPIILGTLFQMAFSDIEDSEKFEAFDIAVVETDEFNSNEIYKESFKELSDENSKKQLFNIKYVTEKKAKELLEDEKIAGYVLITDTAKVVVNSSGADETILKYTVEEINNQENIINTMVTDRIEDIPPTEAANINYEEIYTNVLSEIENITSNIEDVSREHLSYTMIEFYTLIAMACLYGGILAMEAINNCLANMSSQGKRVAVSPASKGKLILSSVFASYITQIIGLSLLFIYTVFVLKVDFGSNLPLIVLLALAGSLAGLSLGIAVSTFIKANDNTKTGILIAVTMFGCFLSGMMGITMKYVVDTNAPVINKINPASMITDGFYALYYYDTLDRYYFNVISLSVFSLILILLSVISLRRQKYDSI